MKKITLGLSLLVAFFSLGLFNKDSQAAESRKMYRLYNGNTGEHFYTADSKERENLIGNKWTYEGIGWIAPSSGDAVYRLYNSNAGDHHYTTDSSEKDWLVNVGWHFEGIGWYSDSNRSVPLKRAYNPNSFSGTHNYTTNDSEQSNLINAGWRDEGIAWYAIGVGQNGYSVPYNELNPNDPLQNAARYLGSRLEVDDEVRYYPVMSGMVQTINGYYMGYIGSDTMDSIKETVRVASQNSNGKPVSLISWARNGTDSETIITAQNGTITYFLQA